MRRATLTASLVLVLVAVAVPVAAELADGEGLPAHARSAQLRIHR